MNLQAWFTQETANVHVSAHTSVPDAAERSPMAMSLKEGPSLELVLALQCLVDQDCQTYG